MRLAINNAAPEGPDLERWGDYHFGVTLQRWLEVQGVQVEQHFWPNWGRSRSADAVLVLRGKRRFDPAPKQLSLLWIISHPSTVSSEEMNSYTKVFVASETHWSMVREGIRAEIEIMRQCTDGALFGCGRPTMSQAGMRRDIIFVANSRGVKRNIVSWAVGAGIRPRIIGRHWAKQGLGHLVVEPFLDNKDLPGLYQRSRLSLNDHWGDMLYFGMINNRIFDCLAAGLPVITDDFPELRRVCGEAPLYARDVHSFASAMKTYTLRYGQLLDRTRELWDRIGGDFSFQARAEQIVETLTTLTQSGDVTSQVSRANALPESRNAALIDTIGAGQSRPVRVLHFAPSPELGQSLCALDNVSYLSCGPGYGPWHVALYAEASPIVAADFDAVVIEQFKGVTTEILGYLIARVRKGGKVLAPSGEITMNARRAIESVGKKEKDIQGWLGWRVKGP